MKLAIASDHGGYSLKKAVTKYLSSKKIDYVDLGVNSEGSVDYPDFASEVARRVSEGEVEAGILICGTGIGMAITANKFKGVRAAVITDEYTARMSKEHNNANVIALGGRILNEEQAKELVHVWLTSSFQGGRHDRRLKKIAEIETEHFK